MKPNKKNRKETQLNFELEFYGKLLQEHPDFLDALVPFAEACTKAGLYERGLEADLRICRRKPDDPLAHYNLGCSYALLEKNEAAIKSLEQAVKLGYNDFRYMEQDPDLNNIRADERFQKLVLKKLKDGKRG